MKNLIQFILKHARFRAFCIITVLCWPLPTFIKQWDSSQSVPSILLVATLVAFLVGMSYHIYTDYQKSIYYGKK